MKVFQKLLAVLLVITSLAGAAVAQGTHGESSAIGFEPKGQLPSIPVQIVGRGQMSAEAMTRFLLSRNPSAVDAQKIVQLYIQEAADEGVNHDIAFAQMCLETGFLRFNGMVPRKSNNFGGFGAFRGNTPHQFATEQEGVRAQIQHLKAYATDERMRNPVVDPRYTVLQKNRLIGTAPTVFALTGKWATDKEYGSKIIGIMSALYRESQLQNR